MFEEILKEILDSDEQAYSLIEYVGNAEFESELIEFTKCGFREAIWRTFPSEKSQRLVMLGLTYIALGYYDGALWPHVCEKYSSVYNDPKLIEFKIRDNILGLFTKKYHCERKHYQIPVINAVVPYNYAHNYIKFVNDIYAKNLDCDLSSWDNLDEEIENVFNAISNKLSDADDSFKYSYDSDIKVYKLIKAIKSIIKTEVKRQELVLFTKDILRNLDSYYNGRDIESSYYIRQSFQKWIDSNAETERQNKPTATRYIKSRFPSYRFAKNSQNIYLLTPIKRLYGDYDSMSFLLQVMEDDKIIFEERNLEIRYILGGLEIGQEEVKISNPLNKVRCKIFYGKDAEVVYDSKDDLDRDYLIFNDEEKEIKNNKSHSGLTYFIYKDSCDGKLTELKNFEHYKCAYCYVNENDEYRLDNEYISFSNVRKSGIYGDKISAMELSAFGEVIPIYKTVSSICLIALNTNKHANKIRINGVYIDMAKGIEIVEHQNSIAYIINFDEMNFGPNIYNVELVNIQQEKTINKFKFLYDRLIIAEEVLTSEYSIDLRYEGSFSIENKAGKTFNDISLEINNIDKKKLYLNIDEELYKCKINLTIPYYKFDGRIWTFSHYLTSDDINAQSQLFFYIDNCSKVLYQADEILRELEIKTYDGHRYIDLSELLNCSQNKLIELSFCSGAREEQYLRIYNDMIFNQEESCYVVDSLNEEIDFKIIIDGRKIGDEVYIRLSTSKGETIGQDRIDAIDNINSFKLGDKIQKLHYCIYRTIKERKGFKSFDRINVLKEEDIAYYPISALINKYLVIDEVQLGNEDKAKTKNLNLKLVKRIRDFYYIGYLYSNNNGKIMSFDKINEVLINLSQVYNIGQSHCCDAGISIYYDEDLDENMWQDNLQYDVDKNTILNGYSRNAPDIVKYRINLTQGEKQYEEFKSNRKSKIY